MKQKPFLTALALAVLAAAGASWWREESSFLGDQPAKEAKPVLSRRSLRFSPGEEQPEMRARISQARGEIKETSPAENFEDLLSMVQDTPEIAASLSLERGSAAVVAVAAAWAERDPAAAAAWAASLTGDMREVALETVTVELTAHDIQKAFALVGEMPEGTRRDDALAFVAAQWAAGHPTEGLQWIRELPHEKTRGVVERRLLPAVAAADPVAAARYLAEDMRDLEMQAALAPEILQRWVQLDPQAAARWTMEFPESTLKNHCWDALLRVWESHDSQSVKDWWANLPAGSESRHEVAAAMATILATTNRDAALTYAKGITDPQLRSAALKTVRAP